eukprot:Lankesteria_metandrocarpae@DN1158_c0_g1_i1.p1
MHPHSQRIKHFTQSNSGVAQSLGGTEQHHHTHTTTTHKKTAALSHTVTTLHHWRIQARRAHNSTSQPLPFFNILALVHVQRPSPCSTSQPLSMFNIPALVQHHSP